MTFIKRTPGYRPVPTRFKDLDQQRKNVEDAIEVEQGVKFVNYTHDIQAGNLKLKREWTNKYIKFLMTDSNPSNPVSANIEIELDSIINFPIGTVIILWQIADVASITGAAQFEHTGVIVNFYSPAGSTLRFIDKFAELRLRKTGSDAWEAHGIGIE